MRINKLKPCPFCGGNQICINVGIYIGKVHESVTIKCDDCGASIWGITEEKAIAAWNRRPCETCHMEYCEELSYDELYPTEAYKCSVCGNVTVEGKPNYCPNCGKKVIDR